MLTACNTPSLKEESKKTIKTVETTFNENVKKPNENSGKIEFFIPTGYEVKGESATNIILKNGNDTYILFINPQEDRSSKVVYQATVDQYKKLDTNKTYMNNNKFGFLTIKQLDNNQNEMTIGVGGAKITTQAKTSNLDKVSKVMMQIVNSVKYNK